MIGRTNALAGGGGITQYSTGTIDASYNEDRTSFTVTGLAFRPMVVYFYILNGSSPHSGMVSEAHCHFRRGTTDINATFAPTSSGFTVSAPSLIPRGYGLGWVAEG